jgi:hypothetical protein
MRFTPAALLLTLLPTAPIAAQAQERHEFQLHVEPVAVGIRSATPIGKGWRVGPTLIAGPFEGVDLNESTSGDLQEVLNGFLTFGYRFTPAAELVISPIGASLGTGDDYAAIYPSAQAGLQVKVGRAWIGSDIRVIRIAEGNNQGTYWTQWIPLRVGLTLGKGR